jgi:hypothetical protein
MYARLRVVKKLEILEKSIFLLTKSKNEIKDL